MRAVLLISLCLLAASFARAEPFAINTGFKPPISTIYHLIMADAFARIGEKVDFREISAERSIELANDGIDDAECCRIWEVNEQYTHLVRVPVPVIRIDFVAFTRDPAIRLTDWDSLAPYDVGVVSGWKILEQGLTAHPPRQLYILDSPESLFGMLDKERIQVATIGRLVGYQKIHDLGLHGIQVVEPPLVSRPLYLFVHEKNRDRVPALEAALRSMQEDGSLERHYRAVVEPLLETISGPAQAPE